MAKKSRKTKTETPATNGQDHGYFLRKYKGYFLYDNGIDSDRTITIVNNGEVVNKVKFEVNGPIDLNRAIEDAKQIIDGDNKKDQPQPPAQKDKKSAVKTDGEYGFKKIKLRDDHFLDIAFILEHTDAAYPVRNPGTGELNWPIHDDLKSAMQNFAVHWMVMTGYVEPKKIKGEIEDYINPLIGQIKITGVSLAGANLDGLSVSGHRVIFGRAVNANVVGKFYDADGSGYPFGTSLELSWHDLINETVAYLNGKRGTLPQPELPFGDADSAGGPIVETAI